MRGQRLCIGLLLIGALLMRVGWVLRLPTDESRLGLLPDQIEYLELGRNLAHNHELSFENRFGTLRAYRTPGYPALVALCGGDIRVIRIAQAVLDTSTVLAAYLLARRWLSRRGSFLAAGLVAVNPFLVYFTGLILTETLFVAMLAWGMVLLSRDSMRAAIAGIAILALSILVRPSAMLLPVLLMMLRNRHPERSEGSRRPEMLRFAQHDMGRIGLASVITILVLLPWAWRNHRVLGRWIWTTTNAGITQYDGFNPQADGSSDQSFVQQMPELKEMDEVERSDYLARLAREYAAGRPLNTLKLAIRKIVRTWSPVPLSDEYGSRRMYVAIAACYSIPLDLLVLWGLWAGKLPCAAKVFLILPAIYFTAVHAMSVGSLRYRIPAEVPMAVLAVAGIGYRVSGSGSKRLDFNPRRDPRNPTPD